MGPPLGSRCGCEGANVLLHSPPYITHHTQSPDYENETPHSSAWGQEPKSFAKQKDKEKRADSRTRNCCFSSLKVSIFAETQWPVLSSSSMFRTAHGTQTTPSLSCGTNKQESHFLRGWGWHSTFLVSLSKRKQNKQVNSCKKNTTHPHTRVQSRKKKSERQSTQTFMAESTHSCGSRASKSELSNASSGRWEVGMLGSSGGGDPGPPNTPGRL